jgi:hypothetical protein
MKLQTKVPHTKTMSPVSYDSRMLLLGSCFASNMGERFRYFKFHVLENPFGILYLPHAIANLLKRAVQETAFDTSEFFEYNGGWHSFEAHSEMSSLSATALQNTLNKALRDTRAELANCSHLLITLGTAWAYRHKASGALVANCHKLPQSEFIKELLPISALQSCLKEMIEEIRRINTGTEIIFTISPVRHLKDGFIGNQRSKAHLIGALHEVLEGYEDKALNYFPAYEIIMDELRDYRFYDKDLLHPNSLAADYIWEVFRECWISGEANPVMDAVQEIRKGLGHRPFNADSQAYREFRKALDVKIAALQKNYPKITFDG